MQKMGRKMPAEIKFFNVFVDMVGKVGFPIVMALILIYALWLVTKYFVGQFKDMKDRFEAMQASSIDQLKNRIERLELDVRAAEKREDECDRKRVELESRLEILEHRAAEANKRADDLARAIIGKTKDS